MYVIKELGWHDLPGEKWMPIQNTNGYYSISNLGRVRSEMVPRGCGNRPQIGQIRKQVKSPKGYYYVSLSIPGHKRLFFTVHSLVALAFLGSRPENLQINHKNGDKSDNSVSNLEYVTGKENSRHAYKMGLLYNVAIERLTHNVVLSDVQVSEILSLRCSTSINEIATKYKVGRSCVKYIFAHNTWKHIRSESESSTQATGA